MRGSIHRRRHMCSWSGRAVHTAVCKYIKCDERHGWTPRKERRPFGSYVVWPNNTDLRDDCRSRHCMTRNHRGLRCERRISRLPWLAIVSACLLMEGCLPYRMYHPTSHSDAFRLSETREHLHHRYWMFHVSLGQYTHWDDHHTILFILTASAGLGMNFKPRVFEVTWFFRTAI